MDLQFLDIFSRIARDSLPCEHLEFGPWGIFTEDQASFIFTAILRLLEIPVSQVTSPYSPAVDIWKGLAAILERDQRKYPPSHHVARWIVMSFSPACVDEPNSVLARLEGLVQAIETFYHPSNTGGWTKNLSQLIFYLADFFVMRWNRERSGEMDVLPERRLNETVKRRFVTCLLDVTFLGIFAKSSTAISYSLSTLQSLAILEPELVLPGALQRIYPSLRGLVEVHRTTSSIRALHELTRIMTRTKGFRCHVTSLLGLALPGIDANDLDKTMHTLSFMQAVFYEIPMIDLTKSSSSDVSDDAGMGGMLAAEWVTNQIERLEVEGGNVEIDYDTELSDEDEAAIVRSSTAEFRTFITSFLDSVFNMLRNLPDASRVKNGSPEENIANTLPATLTPLFSTMSPELYDLALHKIVDFVSKHVVYQARDSMAFICSCLTKVDPKKSLSLLIPVLSRNIKLEIEENGAGSTRTTGSEVLPRDKALVWNISLLSMSLVHVGSALVDFADEILDIAQYMHQHTRGIPSTHASNFIHHVLLTLTMTYTADYSLFEDSEISSGVTTEHWAKPIDPHRLNIKWHYPDDREISFAIQLFQSFGANGLNRLEELTSNKSPIKLDGSGKDWSDEVSRNLVMLRLMLSGISVLFDPRHDIGIAPETIPTVDGVLDQVMTNGEDEQDGPVDADYGATEDEDVKPTFQYPTGYQLVPGDPNYVALHNLRTKIGEVLHRIHQFLSEKQQDDVTSFNALYTAYRTWFTDVGFERSAHVLDRVTRLFVSDIGPFKISGLRKEYPRPLLVRRANVYHLQRLRHNASPRHKTDLDKSLLLDLVQSSVSLYTEIRRTAQTAVESTMKVMIGARPVVIPPMLDHFASAVRASDFPRIKGAMYSLLFGSLTKPVSRDWRYTPSLIKSYVDVMDIDKLSVQKAAAGATLQVMDMTRTSARMVILDKDTIEQVSPEDFSNEQRVQTQITKRRSMIQKRQDFVKRSRAELSSELAEVAKNAHWKKESRTATLVIGLSLRFEDISSPTMIDLVVRRSIDSHPSLRSIYNSALIGLFTYTDMRAIADHKYENYLLDKQKVPSFVKAVPQRFQPGWNQKFLSMFAKPEAELYVDDDHPGWLVWGRKMPAFDASKAALLEYDDVEQRVRKQVGSLLDREWFSKYFNYMKQEPRDSSSDRFRTTNAVALNAAFTFIFTGLSPCSFDDIKELVQEVFQDGSDKHQHRATAEILGGLVSTAIPLDESQRSEIWSYVFPIVRDIFEDGLTPENSSYWNTFLDIAIQNKDPRRSWPLIEWLASFRLDMSSNAAFKESSKITLLEHCIIGLGWHFRLDQPILENFLSHLDHPYKGVRGVMGQTIAIIYRARYHESYSSVESLMDSQSQASSIGTQPYPADADFTNTISSVFSQLDQWRHERQPGQQTASAYTSAGKTILTWLESTLYSNTCTQLIPFFPNHFLESLLHMMDIKEDPELQSHAYSVFRHMGNVPYRAGEEAPFVEACIRIGRTAASWHQRLRIMINIQAIYFRHLFLMPRSRQQQLFDCISAMLEDPQLEVRVGAGTTLSGMIRCSPVALRQSVIDGLIRRFSDMLRKNPAPSRQTQQQLQQQKQLTLENDGRTSSPSSASSSKSSHLTIMRHAAVLGLGALVQAFPYVSPPPKWMPGVLTTLATKAAADPGVVGKAAKGVVSDFKKTRQDTWHIDVKVSLPIVFALSFPLRRLCGEY